MCPACDCILDLSFLELGDDVAKTDASHFEDEKTGAETLATMSHAEAHDDFDEKTGATPLVADDEDLVGDTNDDAPTVGDSPDDDILFDGTDAPLDLEDEPVGVIGGASPIATSAEEIAATLGDAMEPFAMSSSDAPLVDDDVVAAVAADAGDERGAYGAEAIILGNVGVGAGATDFESMLSDATSSIPLADGGLARVFEPSPVYVSESVQKMVEADAVLALREGANLAALSLSPFEQHVLSFIDGQRPVARIRKKAGLGASDLKIAIGMLSDRNLIVVKGHIKPDVRSMLDEGDLDESGEFALDDNELPPPSADDDRAREAPIDLPLDAMSPLPSRTRTLPDPDALPIEPVDEGESVFSGGPPVRAAALRSAMPPREEAKPPPRPQTQAPASQSSAASAGRGVPLPSHAAAASTASRPSAPSSPQPVSVRVAAAQPVDAGSKSKALQVLELGLADLRNGKKSRALGYVKMAAELDPTNEKAQVLLKDWAHADKLAKAESEDHLLVADAQRAEDQGQYDRAAELYRKAIAMKPNEPELYNRLGIICALRLQDFTSATSALMKACELAPDNLAYRSNLGKIFKISDGAKPSALYRGSDSDALRDAAKENAKPTGFMSKLRGK